jgi:hypothetical protein
MNSTETSDPKMAQLERRALIVGVVALALCALGYFFDSTQFFRSYLLGYLFWIGIVLGSFALLMLHHLAGGGWGFAIQRCLESSTRTIPVLALLALPLVFGLSDLYLWAQPDVVAADEVLQHKSPYLNIPFFLVRMAGYFAIWFVLAHFLNKWSLEQDRAADPALRKRLEGLSGPGLLLLGLTITFSSVDWVMSLEPHWFSTIYGFLFIVGNVLAALTFSICMVSFVAGREPLSRIADSDRFHDLGNLTLAFVMLWAYISFSQYLIIWSGNLKEEIPWYLHRTGHGWMVIAIVLIVFHFAVPFVLLLSRRTKRGMQALVTVAGFLLLMRWVDLYWLVAPNFHQHELYLHWMDLVAPAGIGGVWLAFFLGRWNKVPLLPLNDPRLVKLLEVEHSGGH